MKLPTGMFHKRPAGKSIRAKKKNRVGEAEEMIWINHGHGKKEIRFWNFKVSY